jgi:hypothetical protein
MTTLSWPSVAALYLSPMVGGEGGIITRCYCSTAIGTAKRALGVQIKGEYAPAQASPPSS